MVCFVGRLTEVKNHLLFLQIAKLWRENADAIRNPVRVRFIIIGDGHLREPLERQAAELGLTEKQIVFAGERHDPQNFYPALDVVALTSLNEGTPLTLIEAMANQRAVISTAVGGTIDLLGAKASEINGFEIAARGVLVESENAESFCGALKVLIENHDLRQEIAARGKDYVTNNYSKERLISDIEMLYLDLLGDK